MADDVKVAEKSNISKPKDAQIVEVPTQTAYLIELEDGRRIDELTLMVEIYNEVKRIRRALT